jgi:hypothetical protein
MLLSRRAQSRRLVVIEITRTDNQLEIYFLQKTITFTIKSAIVNLKPKIKWLTINLISLPVAWFRYQ